MLNKDEIQIIYFHYFRIKADKQKKYEIGNKLFCILYIKKQITKLNFFAKQIVMKLTNRKVIG